MPNAGIDALFFNSLAPSVPSPLRNQLLALPHDTLLTVDTLLRFVLGAQCPEDAPQALRSSWTAAQQEVAQRVHQLKDNNLSSDSEHDSRKRARDDEPVTNAKRAKTSQDNDTAASSTPANDPPLFTLHALSLTSPIRKKADITVHEHTLRLTHPSTHATEHPPVALSVIRRAFLLPTRGKTKQHWSIILMPSDVPTGGSKAAKEQAKDEAPPIVFGVDATPNTFSTTGYGPDSTPQTTTHPKGTPVVSSLRSFLERLSVRVLEPSTDIFRSAIPGNAGADGVAGVEAYRGAKPGTLWFFSEGVLWDGRPAEFFALCDLARNGSAGEVEGVRTISATGRTCSVILRRIEGEGAAEAAEDDAEDEEPEERTVDVDFGMVDGKEQEGITRWARQHRHLFGKRDVPPAEDKGKGKAVAPVADEASDEEDSDFVDEASSDGGSATSDSESESGDAQSVEEGDAQASDDEEEAGEEEDDEEEDDEEGELDPARHPLLRPGPMPKLSRAAMNMVVGMVESDLLGTGSSGKQGASESEEEDELDD